MYVNDTKDIRDSVFEDGSYLSSSTSKLFSQGLLAHSTVLPKHLNHFHLLLQSKICFLLFLKSFGSEASHS